MTKLHIENIHIHIDGDKPSFRPHHLLTVLAGIAERKETKRPNITPAIGDKWPGTEAIYAGKSLSRDGSRIVDLIFWPDSSEEKRTYVDNIKYCESVSPEMNSHAATRQQAIVINDNLRHLLSTDHAHWTETKDNTGTYAFVQSFIDGLQDGSADGPAGEFLALAVSETIPLKI